MKASAVSLYESQPNHNQALTKVIDHRVDLAWKIRRRDPLQAFSLTSKALYECNLGVFEKEPYVIGQIRCLRNLAYLNVHTGHLGIAFSQNVEGLELIQQYPDPLAEGDFYHQQAMVFRGLGNLTRAFENITRAAQIVAVRSDISRQVEVLNTLAIIYIESGDQQAGLECFKKSLDLLKKNDFPEERARTLNNQAMLQLTMGNCEQALKTSLAGLEIAKKARLRLIIVNSEDTLGQIYLRMGNFGKAFIHYNKALRVADHLKSLDSKAEILLNITRARLQENRYGLALQSARKALQAAETTSTSPFAAAAHELISIILEKQRRFPPALEHFKRFHQLNQLHKDAESESRLANLKVVYDLENAHQMLASIQVLNEELQSEIIEEQNKAFELEKLASTDPLTGLLNRRSFFELAENMFLQARNTDRPLSVLLIDIDLFKSVNDNFGHNTGDMLLVALSNRLRSIFRKSDVICRYGGEEFVILVQGATALQAGQFSERTRQSLEQVELIDTNRQIQITISVGVSELAYDDLTIETVIHRADQALYAAKKFGRNAVALNRESVPGDPTIITVRQLQPTD